MSNRKIIRWGIIGVGDVCEVKSGPALYKSKDSQLLAVMRRNIDKARDFAQRHQVAFYYDDATALLANPDIDAVYIATPPAFHKDFALAAIAAGKQVYIEKPVTLNAAECDPIIAAAQRTNAKVCAAHYRRYVPCFIKFADLLKSGAIGIPLLARIDMLQPAASNIIAKSDENWRVNPAVSGGGLFHDLAPHQLDLLLQWFGSLVDAQGMALNQRKSNDADDCVIGNATFSSGAIFQGCWHFAVNPLHTSDTCEILGTEGKISINFFGQQVIHLHNADGEQEFIIPNPEHIQLPMIEQVNAYFRGERDNPCSIQEAKAVMELIDIFSNNE
ncbi:oxidoreductase [Cellvibrio zantedeschiae]|uniref:Oxidoreductase n=1 Tax=Cellvibrio zantedeschiae TaxID=1237077 RepID=A0ABQ3B0J2_9GAMM|nr:Gfo/Idh/MocA family oxidoreductase [Cellvibrio zantedeschiae]GGY71617.1 oxidoreductase [Cellvibrio zantedeschiae]